MHQIMHIVGYPESGNTWLGCLLAYCLNAEYHDLDNPDIHHRDEYHHPYLKEGLEHPTHQAQVGKVFKTHCLEIANQDNTPVVYLVRDGRDVMISYYHYNNPLVQKTIAYVPRKTILGRVSRKIGLKKLATRLEISPFSKFLYQQTSDWARHVKTWIERNPVAILRYEDLQTIPEETLGTLMMRLGVQVSPKIIQQAVEIFSLDYLSKCQPDEEDRKSFYRVGEWKNRFSTRDSTFFREKAGDVLEMLGYDNYDD